MLVAGSADVVYVLQHQLGAAAAAAAEHRVEINVEHLRRVCVLRRLLRKRGVVRQQMDHHAAKLIEAEKTRLPMKRGLTKTLTTRSPSPVGADGDEDRARWGRRLCGPVLHPDGKFRSGWNVMVAFLIMYCGIQVPLEISFDTDMSRAMCGIGEDALLRSECPHFLTWFWCNFVIDMCGRPAARTGGCLESRRFARPLHGGGCQPAASLNLPSPP